MITLSEEWMLCSAGGSDCMNVKQKCGTQTLFIKTCTPGHFIRKQLSNSETVTQESPKKKTNNLENGNSKT